MNQIKCIICGTWIERPLWRCLTCERESFEQEQRHRTDDRHHRGSTVNHDENSDFEDLLDNVTGMN